MPLVPVTLAEYFNRFDPADNFEEMLFRPKGLQSAEMNEIQGLILDRMKRISDSIYSDGAVVAGTQPAININTGAITCPSSLIYVEGAIRSVPERSFTISPTGVVLVGVYLNIEEVTEVEDPTLRDPATGTKNYNEPGAARLKVTPQWAHDGEGLEPFYPVYTIVDGGIFDGSEPGANPFVDLLARYDREANGGYVVRGLEVRALTATGDFRVAAGVGNVWGYKLDRFSDARLSYPPDPDLEAVTSEPDTYVNSSTPITLNRRPVQAITAAVATLEKTVQLTRGGASGGLDALPDVSVTEIISVEQGATTYVETTDYVLNGDQVDWSPGGAEPSPGSTYDITYRYLASVTPQNVDLEAGTFTVSGAVAGELVLTDYTWRVPRFDRICLTLDNTLQRIKGAPSRFQAVPPSVPETMLLLGTIEQRWSYVNPPNVRNDGPRTVTMRQQENIRELVVDLFDLVGRERLERDVASREPTTKRGVLVDPMIDNDMRDAGLAQTAAITRGALRLPVRPELCTVAQNGDQDWMLPYTEEIVLSQVLETGVTEINPYDNFDPIPALLTLNPRRDFWTVTLQQSEFRLDPADDTATWDELEQQIQASVNLVASTTGPEAFLVERQRRNNLNLSLPDRADLFFLREITVAFQVARFGPGETLTALTFDGVDVTPAGPLVANGSGSLSGTFVIPAGIPVGVKEVVAIGNGGSTASANFEGRLNVDIADPPQPPPPPRPVDPLAQTFTLPESRWITSVDLAFRVAGNTANGVRIQIRTTQVGLPTQEVLAEGFTPGTFATTGWTNIDLDRPLWVEAGVEYALVVLTNDPTHAVALAELGKFDATAGQWVTVQPYTVGVLLKSSNASTWTPFQKEDLTFRLYAASFTSNTRVVDFGPVARLQATSITRSSGTATVTATAHGFVTGETVIVSGADQAEYNGAKVITVTGPNAFTFAVSGSPASPATGDIYLVRGRISDILTLARIFAPTSDTSVVFRLTLDDVGGTQITYAPNSVVELDSRLAHGASLAAILTGTAKHSPLLERDLLHAFGDMQETGTYITRAAPVAANDRVEVNVDSFVPSAASVAVALQANAPSSPSWSNISQQGAVALGDGWLDVNYATADFASAGTETRVRLTLAGTPAARPLVTNLRLAVLTV